MSGIQNNFNPTPNSVSARRNVPDSVHGGRIRDIKCKTGQPSGYWHDSTLDPCTIEGMGYPPKKTACQSDFRFQRYKPLKSVTTAGRSYPGLFGRSADIFSMPKFEYKHLSYHFKVTSQQSKMNATPASVERVQKYVFSFEIYRFVKNRPIYPILPYLHTLQ